MKHLEQTEILNKVDHTLLSLTATWEEIREILDDAMQYGVASACIPPSFVEEAKNYVGDSLKICTVIGFPNGYQTRELKVFETQDAIAKGADEIDMVISHRLLKEGREEELLQEIQEIKKACGDKILKVIVEMCLYEEGEKRRLCQIVKKSGADYMKTSTGFSTSGANFEDVALMKEELGEACHIKAAGGISSFEDAKKFIDLGANRLGTSRLIKILKQQNSAEEYGY